MQIIRDDLMLCDDCMIIAVNADASGLDYSYRPDEAAQRLAAIEAGLARLGPHLVPAFDSETGLGIEEYSSRPCACCGEWRHGGRHEFAILGEG